MHERIAGELFTYCYVVKTGSKSVVMMPIQNRYLEEAKITVENTDGLKFYSEFLYEGWATIFIFKHDYMLEVIKNSPDEPKTVYDHWVLGNMFGYSDEEIGRFIES